MLGVECVVAAQRVKVESLNANNKRKELVIRAFWKVHTYGSEKATLLLPKSTIAGQQSLPEPGIERAHCQSMTVKDGHAERSKRAY